MLSNICSSNPGTLVECTAFAAIGKIQPFAISVTSNCLLVIVSKKWNGVQKNLPYENTTVNMPALLVHRHISHTVMFFSALSSKSLKCLLVPVLIIAQVSLFNPLPALLRGEHPAIHYKVSVVNIVWLYMCSAPSLKGHSHQ